MKYHPFVIKSIAYNCSNCFATIYIITKERDFGKLYMKTMQNNKFWLSYTVNCYILSFMKYLM